MTIEQALKNYFRVYRKYSVKAARRAYYWDTIYVKLHRKKFWQDFTTWPKIS